MRTTRCATQSTVQNMLVVLGRRHCLLHVRALLARWNGGDQETRQVHSRSPLGSQLLHQERADTTGTVTGRRKGITNTSSRIRSTRNARNRHFLCIHDRFIRDEKFRKNMIELGRSEEMCREMDKLANEDHTHHITPDEIRVYRNNWWIRSNTVSSDTMPVRHRADFKQALTTLRQLKNQEDTACYQN